MLRLDHREHKMWTTKRLWNNDPQDEAARSVAAERRDAGQNTCSREKTLKAVWSEAAGIEDSSSSFQPSAACIPLIDLNAHVRVEA